MSQIKVIFDLGANKGQNLDYYLSIADKVVAVEAVPRFINQIRIEFQREIKEGRLIVINAILTNKEVVTRSGYMGTIWESIERPGESTVNSHEGQSGWLDHRIDLITYGQILDKYLSENEDILYVKIDLEGSDLLVLKDLLETERLPKFLSVEIHDSEIYVMLSKSDYKSFSVELAGFPSDSRSNWNFSQISAGPFGGDRKGTWFNKRVLGLQLKLNSLVARDIHASIERIPVPLDVLLRFALVTCTTLMFQYTLNVLRFTIRALLPPGALSKTKKVLEILGSKRLDSSRKTVDRVLFEFKSWHRGTKNF